MDIIAKDLILIGSVLIVFGLIWHFTGGRIPFGKLLGAIKIDSGKTKIYTPITTSILLSFIVSLVAASSRK